MTSYNCNLVDARTLYPISFAAKVLGYHRVIVYRWIRAGKVKTKPVAGLLCIRGSEIQRLYTQTCRTCYHWEQKSGWACACRETADIVKTNCPDWQPRKY